MARDRESLRNSLFSSTARVVIESRIDAGMLPSPEIGTAFIVEASHWGTRRFYLVTPRHVIEGADQGTLLFIRSRKSASEPRLFEFSRRSFGEMWFCPTDGADVALTPLLRGEIAEALERQGVTVMAIPVTDYRRHVYDPPGITFVQDFEEVLFVGYPLGFWDPNTGSPIVRRGVTATSVNVDYQGSPAFLIDGAVHRGMSGAPVVVVEPELIVPTEFPNSWGDRIRYEERFVFLGMITDIHERTVEGERLSLDLGYVLKARVIFSAIAEYESLTEIGT